jgi:Flp pilus assembly protein TadG
MDDRARTLRARGSDWSRRGQSLAELAIAFPLLLLLVAGVLDLAHAFSVAGVLQNAVREGARFGATQPSESDTIKNRVVEEAAGAPLTLNTGEVTITFPDGGGMDSGDSITVTATHQVDLILSAALGLPNPTIARSATMVIF